MTQPRQYVAGPAFTPLPFGLLSALAGQVRTPGDDHWRNGVTYETLCTPLGGSTYDECAAVTGTGGAPPPPAAKEATSEIQYRGATPFTVYAEIDCSAPGFWDNAQQAIERALQHAEEVQVERAFWTGVAGGQPVVYPHLASDTELVDARGVVLQTAAQVVTGSVSKDLIEGIGRLEQALAECYHGTGVLHVPRALAPAMANARLLIQRGNRYETPSGNVVVFGSGYTGSAPDGTQDSGSFWIYATGAMFVYRSGAFTTPPISTLDRSNNLVRVIAERTYVIGWECCHLAVEIDADFLAEGGEPTASDFTADAPLQVTEDSNNKVNFAIAPGTDGQYMATDGGTVVWETPGQPGTLAGPLDGSGQIPADQLPPLALHETFEAANEAEMLAASASAPSLAIRTDFSPAHLFYLHTDPASDIGNWEDLGAGISAGADPTGQVGFVAVNGAAATYMRSDAAPELDSDVYSQSPDASKLGQRTAGGTMRAADPVVDDDLTTRRYVHDLLSSGVVTGVAVVNSVNGKRGDVVLTPLDVRSVPVTGGTMTGPLLIDQNVAGIKSRLAMKLPGTQQDAPTTLGVSSTYLGIGGGEWNANSYRLIGLGYIAAAGNEYPAVIGYQETSTSSNTRGDLILAVRPNNNNVAPTTILRVRSDGQILAEAGAAYTPSTDGSLTSRKYVHDLLGSFGVTGSAVLVANKASQAQAEAGTDDTAWMTPLKTAEAIAAQVHGGGTQDVDTYVLTTDQNFTSTTPTGVTAFSQIVLDETKNQVRLIEGDLYISGPHEAGIKFWMQNLLGTITFSGSAIMPDTDVADAQMICKNYDLAPPGNGFIYDPSDDVIRKVTFTLFVTSEAFGGVYGSLQFVGAQQSANGNPVIIHAGSKLTSRLISSVTP